MNKIVKGTVVAIARLLRISDLLLGLLLSAKDEPRLHLGLSYRRYDLFW